MKPIRLLLVNPASGPSFWGMEHALALFGRSYSTAPLGLCTLAALAPEGWEVVIQDENVRPVDLDTPCDLVGLTAMNVQASRAFALADQFRRRGRTVLIGGPYASLEPDRCAPHADVLFVGEAERTFPAFCRDHAAGAARARYEELIPVDLADSPVPRYDLLDVGAYASLPIQTSRGCPHSCEFCDVIVLQGRRVRVKPVPQVIAEAEAVRRAGGPTIFFADDNFAGRPPYARQLLEALIAHCDAAGWWPQLFSQASVDLAEHPDLLALMTRAGFTRIFLGVETPRRQSLEEAGKRVNTRGDLLERIATIQRAGLMIWAGMIVGFDADDASVFDEQFDFLQAAGIPVAMVGMLNAPPRTPLHARLAAEGRIAEDADWADNCAWTNIIPKQMTRAELLSGYARLIDRLYAQDAYAARVLANVARMAPPPPSARSARVPSLTELRDLGRAAALFTLSRDPVRRRHFLPNFLATFRDHPARIVETAIHLGMWSHYETYVPTLVAALERSAEAERVRERERAWTWARAGAIREAAKAGSTFQVPRSRMEPDRSGSIAPLEHR